MATPRLTVVLSQGQSQNPVKRALEEEIAAALIMEPGIDVSIVPHLYDLTDGHTGMLFLRSVQGDMVILSWMYPRAAFWELDRAGIKGHMGTVLLKKEDAEEDGLGEDERADGDGDGKGRKPVIGPANVPNRCIYCLDLRDFDRAQPYLDEIRRIAAETRVQLVPIEPELKKFLAPTGRRWYPVIDYARCTNCMECIDFCLFGVYGVDGADRILVEQPDNCKKGCPACSRVCPEHAIIFPMHKTPEIAGAPGDAVGSLKIDLSKLFGGSDAFEIAALERDAELIRDGLRPVGLSIGLPKRQAGKPIQPKDELDKLVDQLDALEI